MPLEPACRHPLPSIATAPQMPRPPVMPSTLLLSFLLPEQSGGDSPIGVHGWLGSLSDPLTKHMIPTNVPLPEVVKPPQCQISRPGRAIELMQSGCRPLPPPPGLGGSVLEHVAAAVLSKLSLRLPSKQLSTNTTAPETVPLGGQPV